jgi:uncharacterized protein involved in exopolysaccharide biosynthesis
MKNWLTILNRRKVGASLIALTILALGTSAAVYLPSSYRSLATILVDQQEVSDDNGGKETGYADHRLQILTKRVLSKDNLNKIAKSFALFEEDAYQNGKLSQDALGGLRKNINMEMINTEVIDSKMRFKVDATIAFDISYIGKDPHTTQRVTKQLVKLFFEENLASQANLTAGSTELLQNEEKQLRSTVNNIEGQLRDFNQRSIYTHPDMKDSNIRGLEKTADEISETKIELRSLEENRTFLESELVRLSPNATILDSDGERIRGKADTLKELRAKYALAKVRYSDSHPDLARLRKQIASLEGDSGETSAAKQIRAELKELTAKIKVQTKRYSESHPSIKSIKRKISSLSKQLSKERSRTQVNAPIEEADNPAYITAHSQLKAAGLDIKSLEENLAQLDIARKLYEERLEKTPAAEREFNQLQRQYKQATNELESTRKKRLGARLSGSLGYSANTEGLQLLEEANFPEKAHKPNRKLLLVVTAALAGWAAIGFALVREHFDDRLWTTEDLIAELTEPPLTVIPNLNDKRLQKPKSAPSVLLPDLRIHT